MSKDSRRRRIVHGACILLVGGALGFAISKLGSGALEWRNPLPSPEKSKPSKITEPRAVTIEEVRTPRSDRLLVDARPYLFFKQGHIPGAINLAKSFYIRDFGRLEDILNSYREKQIVVYCASSDCEDAAFVAGKLLRAGWKRVDVFTGGWKGWQTARLPEQHE